MEDTDTSTKTDTPTPDAILLEVDEEAGRVVARPSWRIAKRGTPPPLTAEQVARCDAAAHALLGTETGQLLREEASGNRVIYSRAEETKRRAVV